MLERTAACLEPCGLRVLPPSKRPLRSVRHLHTAFWQHGAAGIELTAAWQALMHGTLDAAAEPEHDRSPSLSASTFLLDFLYPPGVLAQGRHRLSPISPPRSDRLGLRTRPSHVSHRLFNSSLPHQHPEPSSATRNENRSTRGDRETQDDIQGHSSASSIKSHAPKASTALDNDNLVLAIECMLKSEGPDENDTLWRHFNSLDELHQNAYFHRVLVRLSTASRASDSRNFAKFFHKLDVSSWNSDTVVAGVLAEISQRCPSRALSIFERALRSDVLDTHILVEALDLLLAVAIRSSTTRFLEELWKLYPLMAAWWDFDIITADLKHTAAVPRIAEKAMLFLEYIGGHSSNPSGDGADREALQVLQKILVRSAIISCEESQVIPLLLTTKDPEAFDAYLRSADKKALTKVSIDVYALYRELPGCSPSHAALHCAFRAYTQPGIPISKMIAGANLLWDDWHTFHTMPSRRAFQRQLTFHAAQGNKERVFSLWTQYVELFHDDPSANIFDIIESGDTFAHLLQVHAVNAEPRETQRIFDDMKNKFKIQPSVYNWNILLNAYAKANDYDGATRTFDALFGAVKPDKYSYGTMMQMAGLRGDLGLTVDLYRRARSSHLYANEAMLSSLVDAYCQNDFFKEAEDVCTQSAGKGIIVTGMWNKLLYYHALRRDLASINKILNTMAERDVPYDMITYQQLLFGLALCRQSQHALHLLGVALEDKVFEVTPAHFQIVMGALLRTGEPTLIKRLCQLMNDNGIPITEEVVFHLSRALAHWKELPPDQRRQRSDEKWLGDAQRMFFQIYGHEKGAELGSKTSPSLQPTGSSELLRSGREIYHFGTMMSIFAQLNDSVGVNELLGLYRHVFHGTSNDDGILPLSMLNAVMLSSLQDHRHDRVRATWELVFKTAKKEARSADPAPNKSHANSISPKYRYILSGGLRIMQEMLFKENKASGILELISEVREAGFEVDSKNWNYHVQILVQLKQYRSAFEVCEKMLMPNWTGWYTARAKKNIRSPLSLDRRRKGLSPRYLRPTTTTLYRLAEAYLELSRLATLSRDAASALREIEEDCSQAVRAINSMARVHSELEANIFCPTESIEDVDTSEPGEGKVGSSSPEAEAEKGQLAMEGA
ncbi:hypothetical protein F4802DRAFT_78976 [Xylaria palmicola]|nr:hypothetical protein F4802DRAFT_78976 [Xylaria palmicola]